MPQTEFKLISETDQKKFEEKVNASLADDWEFHGTCSIITRAKVSPGTDYVVFYQPMLRKVRESIPGVAPIGIGMSM